MQNVKLVCYKLRVGQPLCRLSSGTKNSKRMDCSIVLWMKTSGWYDVQKWVLSFGVEARVLEPENLRDKVKNEVAMMFKGYGGKVS